MNSFNFKNLTEINKRMGLKKNQHNTENNRRMGKKNQPNTENNTENKFILDSEIDKFLDENSFVMISHGGVSSNYFKDILNIKYPSKGCIKT